MDKEDAEIIIEDILIGVSARDKSDQIKALAMCVKSPLTSCIRRQLLQMV